MILPFQANDKPFS